MSIEPSGDDGKVLAQDRARSRENARAVRRRQRTPREKVAERTRRDRRVIVVRPQRRDGRLRSDNPSDSQPGQSIGFRQPARHDDAIRAPPHRCRLAPVELRSAINLVRKNPGARARRDCRDAVELRRVDARPGRIVWIADDDQLRARRHQSGQRVDVDAPAAAAFGERPLRHRRAERARQAPRLHVVRYHEDDFVAGLDEMPRGDVVGFRSTIGDLNVVGGRIRIERRDIRPQGYGAVRLRVAQRLGHQRVTCRVIVDELGETQRLNTALRKIEVHRVLVGGLHAFHRKLFEFHERRLYTHRFGHKCTQTSDNHGRLQKAR